MKLQAYQYLFRGLTIVMIVVNVNTMIIIRDGRNVVLAWRDCLYKRYPIYPWDNSSCGVCATSGTRMAEFDPPLSQDYRDCSEECPNPTICTTYKYQIDGVSRPECYQCEHEEYEGLQFVSLQSWKICSDECRKCAIDADLSTAIYCSYKCDGHPTFCYPKEVWFGHYKCYQNEKMYGCAYKKAEGLAPDCEHCATTIRQPEANTCALLCDGIPTYREIDEKTGISSFMQCAPDDYSDVFEYNLPEKVLRFLKTETPLSLSKKTRLEKYVPGILAEALGQAEPLNTQNM